MSRLKLIRVLGRDGLKGWKGEQPLDGADVFVGPNGAGKSTRLLAVSAALRGLADVPSDDTRDYLGPERPAAIVELEWVNGHRLTRDLTDSNKTARSRHLSGVAESMVGPALVRWDLADFAGASEAQRTALVERVCRAAGSEGWNRDRVAERLDKAMGAQPAARPACLARVLHLDMWDGRVGDAAAWFPRALAYAKAAYTETNATLTESARHVDGYAGDGTEAPPGTLAEARRKFAELRERDQAVTRMLAAGPAYAEAVRAHEERGTELACALVAAEAIERDAIASAAQPTKAEREAAALEPVPDLEPTRQAYQAAEEAWNKAAEETANARDALSVAEGEFGAFAKAAGQRCTHCGGADPLGQADDFARAQEKIADAKVRLTVATRKRERAGAAALEARRLHDEAATHQHRHWLATTERSARLALDQAVKDAGARHADAQVLLDRWRATAPPVAPVIDVGVEAEAETLPALLREQQALVEQHVAYQARETGYQRAVSTREKATTDLAQIKALGTALKELQADIAADAFAPLTKEAQRVLAAFGIDMRLYFARDSFGAVVGKAECPFHVPYWSLSDSERALVAVAVSVAVARLMNAPWRAVLLDGIECVTEERIPGILNGLGAMVAAGELDNALVAWARATPAFLPGLNERIRVHFLPAREA